MQVDAGLMETYIRYCADPCNPSWESRRSWHELFYYF